MAFWGVEVQPGKPYIHDSSRRGRLRVTQATLNNYDSAGWTILQCSVGNMMPVRLCLLNSASVMCRLELEYKENFVFHVLGDSSVHLTGYYMVSNETSIGSGNLHPEEDPVQGYKEAANFDNIHSEEDPVQGNKEAANFDNIHPEEDPVQVYKEAANFDNIHPEEDPVQGYKEAANFDNIHPEEDPDHELVIEELQLGNPNAKMASIGKKVHVKYVGSLLGGEVIDPTEGGSDTHKFTLGAGKVILGWERGITGMRVGGKRRLTIPPSLGYKDIPQENIPANSWLTYEVELLRVSRPRN